MLAALHIVDSASWAALIAAIASTIGAIAGLMNRSDQKEIKVLVNGRMGAALTRIEQLEATIKTSNKELPADPLGPHS